MDSFHNYLKNQLVEYVEAERKKGIPLPEIEKVLLDAGHKKNIIDEVFLELEKEKAGQEKTMHKEPAEKDLIGMLKSSFEKFMAQASQKEVKEAQKDLKDTDTDALVEEVIEDVEIIEEKTMLESAFFFVYLVIIGLAVLFSAGGTDSQIVNVAMGFAPALISVFISFLALRLADNVPLYMFIPLGVASAFYGVARFTGLPLFSGLDPEGLAIVNFLIGFIFNVIIVYIRFLKPWHMKRRVIENKNNHYQESAPNIRKEDEEDISELKKEFNL